jgi:hypothetical protein
MSKYKYPAEVLLMLSEMKSQYSSLEIGNVIERVFDAGSLLFLQDSIEESFHFKIESFSNKTNELVYYVRVLPSDRRSVESSKHQLNKDGILRVFKAWIDTLKIYRDISDDTITSFDDFFEAEYFEAFNIDEDGDTKPFDHIKLLAWHNLLEGVEETIQASSEISEEEKTELISESKELRESLGQRTQKSFAKGASKLFAKIKSSSISLMKEVGKEITKRMAKVAIDAGAKILKDGPQFFHDLTQHYLNGGG